MWQAGHGWPGLDVFRVLQTSAGHNRAVFWPAQVLYIGPVLTPVWVGGAVWSLRNAAARAFRPAAIACVIVIALQFVLGGKAYYPGAAFTLLLAAGCVPLERRLAARRVPLEGSLGGRAPRARRIMPRSRPRSRRGRRWWPARYWPRRWRCPCCRPGLCTPCRYRRSTTTLARRSPGPGLVALVARRYDAVPAAQRARTTILAGNYGEAGAIDRYGPGAGLPQVYSGANNFWLWGPPPAADSAAIAVNVDPALLRRVFAHVRLVATFRNGLGVDDDEQGVPVYLATGLRTSWSRAWPAFREYA